MQPARSTEQSIHASPALTCQETAWRVVGQLVLSDGERVSTRGRELLLETGSSSRARLVGCTRFVVYREAVLPGDELPKRGNQINCHGDRGNANDNQQQHHAADEEPIAKLEFARSLAWSD